MVSLFVFSAISRKLLSFVNAQILLDFLLLLRLPKQPSLLSLSFIIYCPRVSQAVLNPLRHNRNADDLVSVESSA